MNNLSDTQQRFYDLIEPYPRLLALWDWKSRTLRTSAFNAELKVMSTGEKLLACFFVSVWLGKNQEFDLITCAASMDVSERQLIANWLLDPFWP